MFEKRYGSDEVADDHDEGNIAVLDSNHKPRLGLDNANDKVRRRSDEFDDDFAHCDSFVDIGDILKEEEALKFQNKPATSSNRTKTAVDTEEERKSEQLNDDFFDLPIE